jgi:hypothetical protein
MSSKRRFRWFRANWIGLTVIAGRCSPWRGDDRRVGSGRPDIWHSVTDGGDSTVVQRAISAQLVRQLISDVHWLAGTERVGLRATPPLGYELILVCAAAAKRSFEASFFDCVRVQDGLIIERVQQADVLGQMRQLYCKALGLAGLDVVFLRL